MKFVHVIMKTPSEPDYLETSALIKTGVHFLFGEIHTVVGSEASAVEVAKQYEKLHPNIRCTVIPLTLNEAYQIGTAAEFEKMLSDKEFMKGVE